MVTPGADPGLVLFSAASPSQLPDLVCKRQNEGVQYLLLMLVGIYLRFAGIVLGCNELACPINFGGSKN